MRYSVYDLWVHMMGSGISGWMQNPMEFESAVCKGKYSKEGKN